MLFLSCRANARLHPILEAFSRSSPPKSRRGLQPKRAQVWVHLPGIHPTKGRIVSWDYPPPVLTCQGLQRRWTIGLLGFDSKRGLGIFLFTTASRTALGSNQPPIQWVPGALSLGIKRPGREADHSPPSSAEVKE
jgi:hypothetical protein